MGEQAGRSAHTHRQTTGEKRGAAVGRQWQGVGQSYGGAASKGCDSVAGCGRETLRSFGIEHGGAGRSIRTHTGRQRIDTRTRPCQSAILNKGDAGNAAIGQGSCSHPKQVLRERSGGSEHEHEELDSIHFLKRLSMHACRNFIRSSIIVAIALSRSVHRVARTH